MKWYVVHGQTYLVKGVLKQPLSICSDDSEGFNLIKFQDLYTRDNVVEISKQPDYTENYDKSTKVIVKR